MMTHLDDNTLIAFGMAAHALSEGADVRPLHAISWNTFRWNNFSPLEIRGSMLPTQFPNGWGMGPADVGKYIPLKKDEKTGLPILTKQARKILWIAWERDVLGWDSEKRADEAYRRTVRDRLVMP